MAVERSEPAGWFLGFALLLCLLGVISVGMGIGAVVPVAGENEEWVLPVTEAMGEDLAAAITLRARDKA